MPLLILIRHGQSIFNRQNIFTGWLDVPLSDEGRLEALKAHQLLQGFVFFKAFTSKLIRAIDTLNIIAPNVPYESNEALNERRYGVLEGLDKDATRRQYGEKQVEIWRRSYLSAPPCGESLKNTYERVIPYYQSRIEALLKTGKNVLICAHGNSLRALIKYIENISDDKIDKIEVATCVPIIYEFDEKVKSFKKRVITK